MGRPRFLTALITIFILLLGLLIGMSILGVEENSFNPLPDQKKPEVTVHPPQESSVFGGDNLIGTNAVRDIVAACGDSIIKIETEVTVTSNTNPFFNDPFFREFFGGSFPQETKKQTGLGSGFIFAEDGYILTNHHVIDGADKINVYLSSREEPYEAKIMGKAPELDLAVLKIEGNQPFPYLSMGDSDLVQVGDWVIAIGNPYGLDHTVTVGVISAMGRPLNIEGTMYQNLFQTDAAINPGNSGGPMLNLQGQVIGINTAVNATAQGIGFAIPTSTVLGVVDELIAGNDRVRPWVGINMQALTPELAAYFNLDMTEGIIIYEVVDDAPAKKAGLQRGDVIISLDGQRVKTAEEIQGIIRRHKVGDEVEFKVYRNGVEKQIVVRLEASK